MKWTPNAIAQLRELAPTGIGSRKIAEVIGCSRSALLWRARFQGISVKAPEREAWIIRSRAPLENPAKVRARWSRLIGPMRDQLRADIGSM